MPAETVTLEAHGDSLRILATSFSFQSVNGLVVQNSAAHTHRAETTRSTGSFLSMVIFRVFQCTSSAGSKPKGFAQLLLAQCFRYSLLLRPLFPKPFAA